MVFVRVKPSKTCSTTSQWRSRFPVIAALNLARRPSMLLVGALMLIPGADGALADARKHETTATPTARKTGDRQHSERLVETSPSALRQTRHPSTDKKSLAQHIEQLRGQLRRRSQELADVRQAMSGAISRASAQAMTDIVRAKRIIALTGLDVDRFLREDGHNGSRIRSFSAPFKSGSAAQNASLVALAGVIQRHQKLQNVLRALPLTAPLDHYKKSSKFGYRMHPLWMQWAMHAGVDLADDAGAAIRATAPGRVVYASYRAGYGNVVEIDHGHGIRTRYAHCDKLLVKSGEAVSFRKKIALLGTTGWSTGPHVHYEILVDGRQVDPMRFITAGKYAHKRIPESAIVVVKTSDRERQERASSRTAARATDKSKRRQTRRSRSRVSSLAARRRVRTARGRGLDRKKSKMTTRRLSPATYRRYLAFRNRFERRQKRALR